MHVFHGVSRAVQGASASAPSSTFNNQYTFCSTPSAQNDYQSVLTPVRRTLRPGLVSCRSGSYRLHRCDMPGPACSASSPSFVTGENELPRFCAILFLLSHWLACIWRALGDHHFRFAVQSVLAKVNATFFRCRFRPRTPGSMMREGTGENMFYASDRVQESTGRNVFHASDRA